MTDEICDVAVCDQSVQNKDRLDGGEDNLGDIYTATGSLAESVEMG